MNPKKIGDFISTLRRGKNLSQYQLAEMIPISRQAISKWERGVTIPDSSTLIRLSDIFEVSINELLAGEKQESNEISQLEHITLDILDDSKKKDSKIRKIIIMFTLVIAVMILIFLLYYFINSYNSVKVYKVEKIGNNFSMYNGIFITTKQKSYLRLGKLDYDDDIQIKKVKLYYTKDNKKHLIFEDESENILITDYYGYNEYFPSDDINTLINNLYLQIEYNNTIETMKLDVIRDFSNNNLFFLKRKESTNSSSHIDSSNLSKNEKAMVDKIKAKGTRNNDGYIYNVKEGLTFVYFEKMGQLLITETNNIIREEWLYYMESNILFYDKYENDEILCQKNSTDSTDKLYEEFIKKYIEKYLL